MSDFPLIDMLDSPLLDSFAPELKTFRNRAIEIAMPKPGCTPCQARERYKQLLELQVEINATIESNPQLKALTPQLIATAKQVYDARQP